MALEHATLTEAYLHEPKGISTATAGKVYVADGAGSGDWVLPSGSAYGELYITGGATSFTLAAASAYSKLDPGSAWTANGSNNVTLNGPDAQITVGVAGVYKLDFWMNFTTAALAASTQYSFKYAVNGTTSTRSVAVQKFTNGADRLHVAASGFATLSANDVVSIYIAGDGTSSGTAITPVEAGLSVTLIKVS